MASEKSYAAPRIDFEKLINTYKKENFKTLSMIHHEFLYSCLHPSMDSYALALERNIYPKELEIYNLKEKKDQESGVSKPRRGKTKFGYIDEVNIEDVNIKIDQKNKNQNALRKQPTVMIPDEAKASPTRNIFEESMKKKVDLLLQKPQPNSKQVIDDEKNKAISPLYLNKPSSNKAAGNQFEGNTAQGNIKNESKLRDISNHQMKFEVPIEYEEEKELTQNGRYKYAISMWEIKQGKSAIQVKEYKFNGTPLNDMFFISHCGKFIYFFLQCYDENRELAIKRVVILNIDTLEEPKIFDFPKEAQSKFISIKFLVDEYSFEDTCLFNNCRYLMMKSSDRVFFIDTNTKQVIWKFNAYRSFDNGDKFIKKIFVKETEPDLIKLIIYDEDSEKGLLNSVSFGEKDEKLLFQNEKQMLELQFEDDYYTYGQFYDNKSLTKITFIMDNIMIVFNTLDGSILNKFYQTGQFIMQKNNFLFEDNWFLFLNDNEDSFVSSIIPSKKTPLKGFNFEEINHSDVKMCKYGVMTLGNPNNYEPHISVNYISGQEVNMCFIQVGHGPIVKAVLLMGYLRLNGREFQDYQLAVQYRNSLMIQSFITTDQKKIDRSNLVNVPMIFLPTLNKQKKFYIDKLYYMHKEGLSVRLERIQFTRSMDYSKTMYETKSSTIYFLKHKKERTNQEEYQFMDYFYIMDESMQIKVLQIDDKNTKAKLVGYQDYSKSAKERWQLEEFEKVEMTEKTIYQQEFATFIHSSEDLTKDYEMFQWESLFNCYKIIDGPIKLDNVNKIMYIVKDLEKEEINNEEADSIDYDGKMSDANDLNIRNQDKEDKLGSQNNEGEVNDSENLSEKNPKDGGESALDKIKLSINKRIEGKLKAGYTDNLDWKCIYDEYENGDDEERIEILFIPFIDQNQINLVYENKEIDPRIIEKKYISYKQYHINEAVRQNSSDIDNQNNQFLAKDEIYYFENKKDEDMSSQRDKDKDSENQSQCDRVTSEQGIFFPQIQSSSFISDEKILAIINDKYIIFSKTGDFLGYAKFKEQDTNQIYTYNKMKIIYISDSNEFFLFASEDGQYKINVYTFNSNNNSFIFMNKYESKRNYNYYCDNNDYLDQVIVNNKGEVIEVVLNQQIQTDGGPGFSQSQYFKIFVNGQQKYSNIEEKFRILQQIKQQQQEKQVNFAFINDYLFLICDNKIEYTKLEENEQNIKFGTQLNLTLDPETVIYRLVQTEKTPPIYDEELKQEIEQSQFVQIVFDDQETQKKQGYLNILTWDLTKNVEHQLLQVDIWDAFYARHCIVKGMNEKFNYMVTSDRFYDLRHSLPFTFLNNDREGPLENFLNINGKKVSANNDKYLGLGSLSKIHNSYNLHNLIYWNAISQQRIENIQQGEIHMEHFGQIYDGNTALHTYAMSPNILQMILDKVKKLDQEGKENNLKHLFFQLIYQNKSGMTAFDIAMKSEDSQKCVEVMLQMLIELPDYRLSQYIKNYFFTWFDMNMAVFEEYLNKCTFKNLGMQAIQMVPWTVNKDEIFIEHNQSETKEEKKTQDAVKEDQNKPKDFQDQMNLEEIMVIPETERNLNQQQKVEQEKPLVVSQKDKAQRGQIQIQEKRVEVFAVEFDWIFEGSDAISFVERLSQSDKDDLFMIESIRLTILFLWDSLFHRIFFIIFCPFIFYLVSFCIYVTYIYEQKVEAPGEYYWEVLDILFIVICLVLMTFFIALEVRQMYWKKLSYFDNFWNDLDICSFALNIAFVVCDLSNASPLKTRVLGSCAVGIMWIKFFYFLRLFGPTLSMIRMIIEIIKDMASFSFVLLIAMVGFGNVFYILCVNTIDSKSRAFAENPTDEKNFDWNSEGWFIGQNNLLIALIYSFRTGLGDFNTDYAGLESEEWIWIIFLLEAILIQIILLNLLIAIMGDTFGRVTTFQEQSKLKEMCSMLAENEFIFDRSKTFKNTKYIIVAKLEKAENGSGSWEGQFNSLKVAFQTMLNDNKKETKMINDNLREEMLSNYRGLDQKFNEVQGQHQKTSSQIVDMQKEIRNVSDKQEEIMQAIVNIKMANDKQEELMQAIINLNKQQAHQPYGIQNQ